MPDLEDDWMNPWEAQRRSQRSQDEARKQFEARKFLIQRQRVIMCSWVGSGGPPTEWDEWARFDTKGERDQELARLRREHPSWHLRAREIDPRGRIRHPDHLDWPPASAAGR